MFDFYFMVDGMQVYFEMLISGFYSSDQLKKQKIKKNK